MPRSRSRRRTAVRPQPVPGLQATPPSSGPHGWSRWDASAVCLLLGAAFLTFGPVLDNDFINYDDTAYVTECPQVQAGLTRDSVRWAFTTREASNWHPLTWLSLMLDRQLFGPRPFGFHLTNLLLHLANTVLLFVVLRAMTGLRWRSAFVAALFALHPLHVESVAWVAERKDVLSTFFALLALLAYAWYARSPRLGRYLLVVLGMTLSLLAKPMFVTLPCLLLLLDYWPLRRLAPTSVRWLLLEKVPLFTLSAAASMATLWAQWDQAVISLDRLPLTARLANVAVSYLAYLWQTAFPLYLAVHYPLWQPPVVVVIAAVLVLAAVTALAWRYLRTLPYLGVGWLWYLGMLVPVIGLVQVGKQAHADRYTYFPLVGIFLVLVWGAADLAARWARQRLAAGLSLALLVNFAMLAWAQTTIWANSKAVWTHARDVTRDNAAANVGLARVLLSENLAQAEQLCRDAIRFDPTESDAYQILGLVLLSKGKDAEAARYLRELGRHSRRQAEVCRREGLARQATGRWQEGANCFHIASLIDPALPLGLDPAWVEKLQKEAWAVATRPDDGRPGSARQALHWAQLADHVNGGRSARTLDILAAAYARVGDFGAAFVTASTAEALATKAGDQALAKQIAERVDLYERKQPFTAGKDP
jgi:hypothetical protein